MPGRAGACAYFGKDLHPIARIVMLIFFAVEFGGVAVMTFLMSWRDYDTAHTCGFDVSKWELAFPPGETRALDRLPDHEGQHP
eukprot:gene3293-3798_t